jgi:CheY-like chemotaxis protein
VKRVLLVDDDHELAELLALELRRGGYTVHCADGLLNALEISAEEATFDALITDLHLPDADGTAVAEALGIPIKLALTGSSDPSDRQRLVAAGFASVLVKPLSGKQLLAALTQSLSAAP